MGTKSENTERIRELEEELSDEKIAEIFRIDDEEDHEVTELARYRRRAAARDLIVVAVLAVGIGLAFWYLMTIV